MATEPVPVSVMIVLVIGEPGMGKTALTEAFVRRLPVADADSPPAADRARFRVGRSGTEPTADMTIGRVLSEDHERQRP